LREKVLLKFYLFFVNLWHSSRLLLDKCNNVINGRLLPGVCIWGSKLVPEVEVPF
jgi:hypothetical protein